jgi:hypothetical protein
MIWLQGGPFYELSFLLKNTTNKKALIDNIISKLIDNERNFQIVEIEAEFQAKINEFVQGQNDNNLVRRILDLNTKINIAGDRKFRLFIAELSEELIKVNFWFYGNTYDAIEWEQKGIKEADKPFFKAFLSVIIKKLNPILATIAYEDDCDYLFETNEIYPNQEFTIQKLTIEKIRHRIQNNAFFEYCWINGKEFGRKEDIEIKSIKVSGDI